MKNHYRTEAEWYADYNAMMAAREKSSSPPVLTHSKTIPIARTTGELAHTKPIPIRRTS